MYFVALILVLFAIDVLVDAVDAIANRKDRKA